MVQHAAEQAAIGGNHPFKQRFGGAGEAVLLAQRFGAEHARAHHRRQGQRNDSGDQNGHRQRHGKFAEQAANHIAHEQQRNQYRNQREGQRDNGKTDFTGAFQRRRHRRFAFLDVARNVFDDHDGIIDHKTGGDGQRHQRQVIHREIEQIHHGKGAHQRQWHRHRRNNGGRNVTQKQVDNHHHQRHRQQQLVLRIVYRGANVGGAVGQQLDLYRFGQRRGQCGQHGADVVRGIDNVGAGLAKHVKHNRLLAVGPRAEPAVFCTLFHAGDIAKAHRCAVAVADDQLSVIFRRFHLIVGGEGDRALRAVKAAFR